MNHTYEVCPWLAQGDRVIEGDTGGGFIVIATCYSEQHARLIAAAPHLLEACRMVADNPGLTEWANEIIRAAIAKAKGE